MDVLDDAAFKLAGAREKELIRAFNIKLREVEHTLATEMRVKFAETEKLISSGSKMKGEIEWLRELVGEVES